MEPGFVLPQLFQDPTMRCIASKFSRQMVRDGTRKIRIVSAVFAELSPKLQPTMPFAIWSESSTQAQLSSNSFKDLMRTPRMKEILKQTYPGVIKLREYAGYTGSALPQKPHAELISLYQTGSWLYYAMCVTQTA